MPFPYSGLDFSVNSNPYGPNPTLLAALREADYAHYSGPSYLALRRSLAAWHGVLPQEIAPGVGASELMHRVARVTLRPGDTLLSLHAPFGELERAALLRGARVRVLEEIPAQLPPRAPLVYVGQPHNPTGHALSEEALRALAQACARAGALLLLDLAYAPFSGAPTLRHPALIALYSPGKAHGLVGARPAYAVAEASVVQKLENLAPAWQLPAGTAALLERLPQAQDYLAQTLPRARASALVLADALREFGAVEHRQTPHMTLEVGNAARVAQLLLQRGVKVRDCASYGLPRHLWVSTRGEADDAKLLEALRTLRDAR